ncbi:SH3 domain-containing C40 family peptidase [Methylogaea oryzae]|uniref:SH3 domain-containing C40 family peptidase n=1 Tax=Methylogaea oryzae TaxID=1295382 RepID=UPI00138F798F|nr:SH3 domain-containing C40 family peptidase [Methylogaea oryzae]
MNLRDAPSVQGNVVAILDRGDVVASIGASPDGHWQKVSHGADTGWASFKYLQPVMAEAPVAAFPWFDIAVQEAGTAEISGSGANPRIVEYLRSTTLGADMAASDETPWCSAFVNFCVEKSGFAGTDSAMARSWLNWGRRTDAPVTGCIVVFERSTSPSGHVAFYVADSGNEIKVLGGNQGNKVCFADYPKSRILGYRVPK